MVIFGHFLDKSKGRTKKICKSLGLGFSKSRAKNGGLERGQSPLPLNPGVLSHTGSPGLRLRPGSATPA